MAIPQKEPLRAVTAAEQAALRWRGGTRSRRRSCGRANAGNGDTARSTDCWAVRRQRSNLSYLRHDPLGVLAIPEVLVFAGMAGWRCSEQRASE